MFDERLSEDIILLRYQQGSFFYTLSSDPEAVMSLEDQSGDVNLAEFEKDLSGVGIVFAVPGDQVRLLHHKIDKDEVKHLDASLPFQLEETFAEDIDNLHFSSLKIDESDYSVGVCTHQKMLDWSNFLPVPNMETKWIPEPLLLPFEEGCWTIVIEEDRAIIRVSASEGMSNELEYLGDTLLAASVDRALPNKVVLYGISKDEDLSFIPEKLRLITEWNQGTLISIVSSSSSMISSSLNILSGDYLPKLPYAKWWIEWKSLAFVFLSALALYGLVGWIEYRYLLKENIDLRASIEKSYRTIMPSGAIVDPEKQLRRQLAARGSVIDGVGFISFLDDVTNALSQNPTIRITNINFSQQNYEMRISFTISDFQALEGVMNAIDKAGFNGVLENSTARGSIVNARLRIGRKS